MSKYSNDFKLKVVEFYLKENRGIRYVADYFNISSKESVRRWVKKYEKHGASGLVKRPKSSYDGKFKQNVIEYMYNNHLSCAETSYHFNLGNGNVVGKWKNIYDEKGPQALYKEQSGVNKIMNLKRKQKKLSKETEEDLIAENQRLRMENEYLKKLQALVQKRTKPKQSKK